VKFQLRDSIVSEMPTATKIQLPEMRETNDKCRSNIRHNDDRNSNPNMFSCVRLLVRQTNICQEVAAAQIKYQQMREVL
jgi:hypothetical protein